MVLNSTQPFSTVKDEFVRSNSGSKGKDFDLHLGSRSSHFFDNSVFFCTGMGSSPSSSSSTFVSVFSDFSHSFSYVGRHFRVVGEVVCRRYQDSGFGSSDSTSSFFSSGHRVSSSPSVSSSSSLISSVSVSSSFYVDVSDGSYCWCCDYYSYYRWTSGVSFSSISLSGAPFYSSSSDHKFSEKIYDYTSSHPFSISYFSFGST